jgi:hypothetical protein
MGRILAERKGSVMAALRGCGWVVGDAAEELSKHELKLTWRNPNTRGQATS